MAPTPLDIHVLNEKDIESIELAQRVIDWTTKNGAFTNNLKPYIEKLDNDVSIRGIKWVATQTNDSKSKSPSTSTSSSSSISLDEHHDNIEPGQILNSGDVIASIPGHIVLSERVCLQSVLGIRFINYIFEKEQRWNKITRKGADVYAAGLIMLCGFMIMERFVIPTLEENNQSLNHLISIPFSCGSNCSNSNNKSMDSNGNIKDESSKEWDSYCRCYYPGKYTTYLKSLPDTYDLPIELFSDLNVDEYENHSNISDHNIKTMLFEKLFNGTPIKHIVEGRLKILKIGYKFLKHSCNDLFIVNNENQFTFKRLIWAYCAISSRAFPQDISSFNQSKFSFLFNKIGKKFNINYNMDNEHVKYLFIKFFSSKSTELCLYPSLDFINHKRNEKIIWNIGSISKSISNINPNSSSRFNGNITKLSDDDTNGESSMEEDKSDMNDTNDEYIKCDNPTCILKHTFMESNSVEFVTKTDTPILSNTPIYNNYGSKGNENLMSNYGFVLDTNPEDYVKLSLNINDSDVNAILKRKILEKIYGNSSRWIYMIFNNNSSDFGFNNQFISFDEPENFSDDIICVSRIVSALEDELNLILKKTFELNNSSDFINDKDNNKRLKLNNRNEYLGHKSIDFDSLDSDFIKSLKKAIKSPINPRNELISLLTLNKLLNVKLKDLYSVSFINLDNLLESEIIKKSLIKSRLSLDYYIYMSKIYRQGQINILESNIKYIKCRLQSTFCSSFNNVDYLSNDAKDCITNLNYNWYVPDNMKSSINTNKFLSLTLSESKNINLVDDLIIMHNTNKYISSKVLTTLRTMIVDSHNTTIEADFDEFSAMIILIIEFFAVNLDKINLNEISLLMNKSLTINKNNQDDLYIKLSNKKWKMPKCIIDYFIKVNDKYTINDFIDFIDISDNLDEGRINNSTVSLEDVNEEETNTSIPGSEEEEEEEEEEEQEENIESYFINEIESFIKPYKNQGFIQDGGLINSKTFKWGYEIIDKFGQTINDSNSLNPLTIVLLPF